MLIEVTKLKKTYQLGDIEVPAVRGIDMSIEANENWSAVHRLP